MCCFSSKLLATRFIHSTYCLRTQKLMPTNQSHLNNRKAQLNTQERVCPNLRVSIKRQVWDSQARKCPTITISSASCHPSSPPWEDILDGWWCQLWATFTSLRTHWEGGRLQRMVCISDDLLNCPLISVVFLHGGTNGSHWVSDMITFTSTGDQEGRGCGGAMWSRLCFGRNWSHTDEITFFLSNETLFFYGTTRHLEV